MVNRIKIGNKIIGKGRPCYIIAEAGVNHNGELRKALEMVDIASWAGADAIKFQTFKAGQVVTNSAAMVRYQKQNLKKSGNQMKMLSDLELKEEFYEPIVKRCREKNLQFLSTPHGGLESVDFLKFLRIPAYKIGSGDLANYLLLDKVSRLNKPIILSTGMATFKEVDNAVTFIKSRRNWKIIVLHCTTNYPCPLPDVNLKTMVMMSRKLGVLVGYSDHTNNDQVAIMATTLGAAIYECHFTPDKALPGPDHIASSDPRELKNKIQLIKTVPIIMGKQEKKPTQIELNYMIVNIRKSLVYKKELWAGHRLTVKDLESKRPNNGVSPHRYESFIGKQLKKTVHKDELLKPAHFK